MSYVDVQTSTGIDQIDQTMTGLVNLVEMVFPDRVRGYYLEGSYVDGSANMLSDLDMVIVFKQALSEAESQNFKRLLGACKQMSSCALDIAALGEGQLFAVDTADFHEDALLVLTATTLKFASQLVYGDDIGTHIPQVPLDTYTRVLMHFPILVMVGPRGHPQILPFPIESPDPDDQFLGYTGRRLQGRDGLIYPSTKRIVHSTAFIASALLAYQVGQYSPTKRQAMTAYGQHFDDEWSPFLEEVHEHCYIRWGYRVPEEPADQVHLRMLAEQCLAFENHFLSVYRTYLLEELQHVNTRIQLVAARRLGRICYSDAVVRAALEQINQHYDPAIREAAVAALQLYGIA